MSPVTWVLAFLAAAILALTLAGERGYLRLLCGKPLFTDCASAAVHAAEQKLKAAGIRYTLVTIKSRPGLAQGADVRAHARYNLPYRDETAQQQYVYQIFVARKRRAAAQAAIRGDGDTFEG